MRHQVALVLILSTTACGASSNYARGTATPSEITWSYASGLVANRGGQEISSIGTWSGLEESVGCVPDARAFASGVQAEKITGGIIGWTGLIAIPAGTVAGSAILLDRGRDGLAPGMATIGGSIVGGLIVWAVGHALEGDASADAIDAVNVYNDQHATTPACAR